MKVYFIYVHELNDVNYQDYNGLHNHNEGDDLLEVFEIRSQNGVYINLIKKE